MALPVAQPQQSTAVAKQQTGIQLFTGHQLDDSDLDLLYQTYFNTYSKTPALLSSPDSGNAVVKSTTSTVDNPLVKAGDKRKLTPKSEHWFKSRGKNWIFFGNPEGYVAVRKQASGAYKLITVAGDKKIMLDALKELLNKHWPVWGSVSDVIARILQNPALGSAKFFQLDAQLTSMLYNEKTGAITQGDSGIVKALFGSSTLKDEGNGYLTITDEELGTPFSKVIVGNKEWLKLTHKLGLQKNWDNTILMKIQSLLGGTSITGSAPKQLPGSGAAPKQLTSGINEAYVPIDRKKFEESLFNRKVINGTKEILSTTKDGELDLHQISESIAKNVRIGFLKNLKESGRVAKQQEMDAFLDMVCEHLRAYKGKKDSKFLEQVTGENESGAIEMTENGKIPDVVDFVKHYVNGKKEFRFGSPEYDALTNMGDLEWNHYIDSMADEGITVSYSAGKDCYIVISE